MQYIIKLIAAIIELLFGPNRGITDRLIGLTGGLIIAVIFGVIMILSSTAILTCVLITKSHQKNPKDKISITILNIVSHEYIPPINTTDNDSEKYITHLIRPQTGYEYEIYDPALYLATHEKNQIPSIN